ncbi:hypothetical protein EVAR_11008_1 [Eumeta japonica]|uniref:Uncharacterized protein n=1 Tax=Eumeta variegata TaxID=151549 RepID=A0A4C1YI95_EUMVA|nr:hypothetical protein EVAR_11008_1 [Eumeta japonica]
MKLKGSSFLISSCIAKFNTKTLLTARNTNKNTVTELNPARQAHTPSLRQLSSASQSAPRRGAVRGLGAARGARAPTPT